MGFYMSIEDYEAELGENIKKLRLLRNIERATLCEQCGVSLSALKNLENGSGATLKTLIKVLQGLGKADWLLSLAPVATINPMTMTSSHTARQRARKKLKE